MEEQIIVDAQGPARPFPHFWEHMFGSCHASVTLCEGWRQDLRALRQIVDVKYVRFHGIFEHQVGIYEGEDSAGNLVLNFTRIDLIYDGLLEIGVAPFVELGFMPEEMAVKPSPHSFWYHPNVAPPRDPRQWCQLIFKFAQHLVERYGIEEVANWYFEVWNEPNLDFWTGEPKEKTYYDLYDITASALKDVNSRLRVGGPATAQAAWVDRFIRHCAEKNVPVDFVSTHIYPNDTALNVFGREEKIPQSDMVALAVRKIHDQVHFSARPELPIIWSEYNAGFDGVQLDSPYVGAWLGNNIRLCAGWATEMSYWTFTDAFFEEGGVFKSVFTSGFGLIATGGIPKASFNAFKILHRLGDLQLAIDSSSALLTRRSGADGLVFALWNYVSPRENGEPKAVQIQLRGFQIYPEQARVFLVDADHGSPLKSWQAMGSPDFPSREQQAALRKAAELPPPLLAKLVDRRLSLSLEPNALVVIEFA
ncbi:MAG: glycosyl hydrolase family 39 [Verrucomicrobia bacterium]|nr:glycosyl hydrolase family 39 [Verrucomicrobiota bacterium]